MKSSGLSFSTFKGLKEALDKRRIILKDTKLKDTKTKDTKTKDTKTKDTKTDEEIFSEAMSDVREIREFREIPLTGRPRTKHIPVMKDDTMKILTQIIKGQRRITLSDTPEYIEWVHPHIRKDVAGRLHQGNFSVQDYIDLHGMTLVEAEEALFLFFQEAVKKRLFCVKVIHGRGLRSPKGPVLKEAVIKWLHGQFSKWVLAYSSAKDRDGGLGATYIMLRSK